MSTAPGRDPFSFDLSRCVVADVETYPARWCVGFHGPNAEGKPTTWVVDGDRRVLARTLRTLADRGKVLVTYNGDHFDVPVLRAILKGFDPYAIGTAIIGGSPPPIPIAKLPPLGCDHIDLAARLRRGGGFPSLKKVAAYLGRPRLRELPYAPGTILTDEQWAEVKAYNEVDLAHTRALLDRFAPELEALAALSGEQGRDLRSVPTPRVVERVFLNAYRRERGTDPVKPEVPPEVLYRPVPGVVRPRTLEAAAWHDLVVDRPLPIVGHDERPRPEVPRARFAIGGLTLAVGAGGIHSVDAPGVHYETRKARLVSVDVGSFYPSLMAGKQIAPGAYGEVGAATYRGILERRLEVKRLAKTETDPAERKRLDIQANALKLVLNSTFGKLGDPYSTLFDIGAFLAVTLSGQLMLIDLIERLAAVGVRVLSANTDGLFVKVGRKNRRWREVLEAWQADTGMTLDVDPLRRLAILAGNRFATLDRAGKVKRRGAGLKGDLSPLAAPNHLVVADAVADALLLDVPPERTVRACADPVRFCAVTQRGSKVREAVLVDAADGSKVALGKVTRWYRARDSSLRIVHRFEGDRHTTPANAVGVAVAQDLDGGRLPDDLDFAWYVEQARRVVQKVPGYRHRARKHLGDHQLALEAHARGLAPVPKWKGKAQPRGADRGLVSYLWAWDRFETVGTYTGPAVGVLAIDVDDPVLFKRWVDKGNSPLLANRWRDFDACLVSCHGDATPGQVRAGQARGKILFHLEPDADGSHPLAKVRQNRWLATRGLEVFYGQGMPSVLGLHPDGTEYRLDGTLGPAPDWLLEGLVPTKQLPRPPRPGSRPRLDPDASPDETIEVDPETLDGLPKELAELAPELGHPSVGWRAKDLGDGRSIWVGRCPFEHDSGSGTDLSAGYNQDGIPYVRCLHSSCTSIPEVDGRLKVTSAFVMTAKGTVEPPQFEPSAIAAGMVEDLAARAIALVKAPTGSGKSHAIAQAVALRWREGKATLVAVPTVRLAEETAAKVREFAPEAFQVGAVAAIYGRKSLPDDDGADDGDPDADEDCGEYPIHHSTRIIICTHAQLGRRGFSRFLRGIWEKIVPLVKDGKVLRPAFALIVDEAGEFLRQSRHEIALGHRTRTRNDPDGSGGWIDPIQDCPKSNRSGNCGNCRLARHGGSPRFNRFQIRELYPPSRIEVDAGGERLHRPRSPIEVDPRDVEMGPKVRVGHTTFAAAVRAWKGRPIDEGARRTAPTFIFRRDPDTKLQLAETPAEVLAHLLEFAHRPVMTWEFPVDSEGYKVEGETLAVRIGAGDSTWDDGITFPHAACGVPRLQLTDLLPLDKLRRHAAVNEVGVVFAGATLGPDDRAVLLEVWPDLVDREHAHPDRKIRQVAIVAPEGRHGIGSLVDAENRLITRPLETINGQPAKGLVFCARRRLATVLYEAVAMAQPTARLAVENHECLTLSKTLHDDREERARTFVSYSRGVLGLGVNMLHLRHLVVDANAFRAIGSFAPGEVSVEEFERIRAEERRALILQNVGRALRGEEGKTVVLIVLNADPDLLEVLKTTPAIVEGSELPPVFATGKDLGQLVDQSRRWLEADGGDWPDADPEKAKPNKAGRKPKKTREEVLTAAEEAIASGSGWNAFARTHHPDRQLDATELDALKNRFSRVSAPESPLI